MYNAVFKETEVLIPSRREGFDYTALHVTFGGFPPDIQAHEPHALLFGKPAQGATSLVRPHSGCRTGDLFGSQLCDCGDQLTASIRQMSELAKAGESAALLYLPHHEGRGLGLNDKLKTYKMMQDNPCFDTYSSARAIGHDADERDYNAAAAMISALGLTHIRLLTGNPEKVEQLVHMGPDYNFEVVGYVPMPRFENPFNARYLHDKQQLGHHIFSGPLSAPKP